MSTGKRRRVNTYNNRAFKRPRYTLPPGHMRRRATPYNVNRWRPLNARTAGFLGIENKFVDYEVTAGNIQQTVGASGADPAGPDCLNAIEQGDGENQRDGRKVTLKSIHIRGKVESQANTACQVRIVLVHDTQTNGATIDPANVLLPPVSGTLATHAFRNLQYSKRFRILYDRKWVINPQPVFNAVTVSSNQDKIFKIDKNLNIAVNFTGTTPVVANIADNSLHLMAITDSAPVQLQYTSRCRFVG